MTDIADKTRVEELFSALAEQLAAAGERYELVIIGGAALLALAMTDRVTTDIDVVALRIGADGTLEPPRAVGDIDVVAVGAAPGLRKADPLPDEVARAGERVAADFGLKQDWLNPGPSALMDFGLPDGFMDRVITRTFGDSLVVHFASRVDQIHFKLYAVADHRGAGKHEQDLRALKPTADELVGAARWTRTHDPSPVFKQELERVLRELGVENADLGA